VFKRRTSQSDSSKRRACESDVVEYPREHGERCNRHRQSKKQCKRGERDIRRGQFGVDAPSQTDTQEERQQHTGSRNDERRLDAVSKELRIELESDEKHVDDDADLGDDAQKWSDLRRQEE